MAIIDFRLPIAMMRWFAGEKDDNQKKSIVWTTWLSLIFLLFMMNALLMPLSGKLSKLFFQNEHYNRYFVILFLATSIQVINQIPLTILRYQEKATFYVGVSILKLLTTLVLNINFIVVIKLGVEGIILSQLIDPAYPSYINKKHYYKISNINIKGDDGIWISFNFFSPFYTSFYHG